MDLRTYIKIWAILDDVWAGGEIIVVNPDTCCVLDSDAIIVENPGDVQVSENNIVLMSNCDAIGTNVSSTLMTDERLVGSNLETSRKVE